MLICNIMKIFNADQERNIEINNLLQRIKDESREQKTDCPLFSIFEITNNSGIKYKESLRTINLLREFKEMKIIDFTERTIDEVKNTLEKAQESKNTFSVVERYHIKLIEPNFSQKCEEYIIKVKKLEDSRIPQSKQIKPELLKGLDDLGNEEENDKGKIKKIEIVRNEHNARKIKVIIMMQYSQVKLEKKSENLN